MLRILLLPWLEPSLTMLDIGTLRQEMVTYLVIQFQALAYGKSQDVRLLLLSYAQYCYTRCNRKLDEYGKLQI